MITDKDEIIYSLKKSISELESIINSSIKNNNTNTKEIYYKLGNTLFWIGNCIYRLGKNIYTPIEYNYIQAFMGAYNAQKHSLSLVNFQKFQKGGMTFPMHFPLVIPSSNYYFKKLDEKIIDNSDQIKKYNEVLSNKPIMLEIKEIEKIIISKFGEIS